MRSCGAVSRVVLVAGLAYWSLGGGCSQVEPPTFLDTIDVSVKPTTLQIAQGASGSATLTVTSNVAASVALSASAPAGIGVTFAPDTPRVATGGANVSSTVTVTVAGGTPAGTDTISIKGQGTTSGFRADSTDLTVTVTGPSLASLWFSEAPVDPTVNGGAADELSGSQLTTSGSPTPTVTVGDSTDPAGATFDVNGNLWLASLSRHNLEMFDPAAQVTAGAPPTITITLPAGAVCISIEFDISGTLWVGDIANEAVYGYTANQIATSGSPTPAHIITAASVGPTAGDMVPLSLAFDKNGNGYVGQPTHDLISVYSATQLSTTRNGGPAPANVLASPAVGIAMAFDTSGDLWTTNPTGLVQFTSAQLGALRTNPSPTPAVTVPYSATAPNNIAFDQSGDLWAAYSTNPLSIVRFPAAAITAGGSRMPDVILTPNVAGGGTIGFSGLAFWPIPTGLPLRSARTPKLLTQKRRRR